MHNNNVGETTLVKTSIGEQNWNKYQNQIHKVNDLNNQLLLYSTMLGVTWFINVVDAFLFNGLYSD